MISTFDRAGVRFKYPENWRVVDDQLTEMARIVSLENPTGAIWSLQVYPFWSSPWKLSKQVLDTMSDEYDSLESEQVDEQIDELEIVGYDMHFYCLDFLVAAKARSFFSHGKTFVVWYQAEDREFDELEPVFHAMLNSLIRGLEENDEPAVEPAEG